VASPTPSTRTSPCFTPSAWTLTGCLNPAPTGTARPCASSWPPAPTSSPRRQPRSTGSAPCCATEPTLTDLARRPLSGAALTALARRRLPATATRHHTVRQAEIRRLATALPQAAQDRRRNRADLQAIADDLAPGLTGRTGIGPISAAQVIVSFSHPGRWRSDAGFAALAGTSPLPASSGRTIRHRLNRGGDRALNWAIHTIALTRMRSCARTRDYVARRTAEGKTSREIRRCLKRYITRELFRTLATVIESVR
jgi:transposase